MAFDLLATGVRCVLDLIVKSTHGFPSRPEDGSWTCTWVWGCSRFVTATMTPSGVEGGSGSTSGEQEVGSGEQEPK